MLLNINYCKLSLFQPQQFTPSVQALQATFPPAPTPNVPPMVPTSSFGIQNQLPPTSSYGQPPPMVPVSFNFISIFLFAKLYFLI